MVFNECDTRHRKIRLYLTLYWIAYQVNFLECKKCMHIAFIKKHNLFLECKVSKSF